MLTCISPWPITYVATLENKAIYTHCLVTLIWHSNVHFRQQYFKHFISNSCISILFNASQCLDYLIAGFLEVHKFCEFCKCWSFVKFNPSKKPNCPLKCWASGRFIRENEIAKKVKTGHSRNLSTSKKPLYGNYWFYDP